MQYSQEPVLSLGFDLGWSVTAHEFSVVRWPPLVARVFHGTTGKRVKWYGPESCWGLEPGSLCSLVSCKPGSATWLIMHRMHRFVPLSLCHFLMASSCRWSGLGSEFKKLYFLLSNWIFWAFFSPLADLIIGVGFPPYFEAPWICPPIYRDGSTYT